ncbi:MAG: trypsin-like peptidase domain-containing protein [Gemmatimonadetes bacterium]|nr:trypsin-like peptidase domain-containing protein [Gemmatimonadota bacterium]
MLGRCRRAIFVRRPAGRVPGDRVPHPEDPGEPGDVERRTGWTPPASNVRAPCTYLLSNWIGVRGSIPVDTPTKRFPGPSLLKALAAAWCVGCASPRAVLVDRGPQAHYQTAYPTHDTSQELARLFQSVKQVTFTADYRTWEFAEDAGVTEADVRAGRYRERADTSWSETITKAGTATVVSGAGNRLTLLTVEHLTRFPEVRIEYWDEERPGGRAGAPPRVASVSVKSWERGSLLPPTGSSSLEVVARDERNDLALLAATLESVSDAAGFAVLDVPGGDARRLSWGSFVYVVGYPRGTPMVTRAIVSSPDRDGQGGFVTDGLWNEGISGGLVLGVRGDCGDLELVGLARAGAGQRDIRLRPDTTALGDGLEYRRYDGPLYVQSSLRIQYGISLPVSMSVVGEFLVQHGVSLRSARPDLASASRPRP